MKYMFKEGNHKFRKAVSIINLYAIKMLINNNNANGLVRYCGIRHSLMLSMI